ncbi:hypothetical protein FRB90_010752 [Tulasnella sp. 427]|nr:hypothetical protein FRB90_010752 [Tulasnella sp. 427]
MRCSFMGKKRMTKKHLTAIDQLATIASGELAVESTFLPAPSKVHSVPLPPPHRSTVIKTISSEYRSLLDRRDEVAEYLKSQGCPLKLAYPKFFDNQEAMDHIGIPDHICTKLQEYYTLLNATKRPKPEPRDSGMALYIVEDGTKLGNAI